MEILKTTTNGDTIKILIEDEPRLKNSNYYYRITSIIVNDVEIKKKGSNENYFEAEFDYTLHNGDEYFGLRVSCETGKQICKILNIEKDSIFISLDDKTQEKFEKELIPKGKKMLEKEKEKERNKILEQDKNLKDDMDVEILVTPSNIYLYFYAIRKSFILTDIEIKLNINEEITSKILEEKNFKTEMDWGDYSIKHRYFLTYKDLKEMMPEIVKKAEQVEKEKKEKIEEKARIKKEKLDELLKKAIAENKKQEVCSWCEPCNNKYAECSLDVIHEYINPNGEFTIERHHTW